MTSTIEALHQAVIRQMENGKNFQELEFGDFQVTIRRKVERKKPAKVISEVQRDKIKTKEKENYRKAVKTVAREWGEYCCVTGEKVDLYWIHYERRPKGPKGRSMVVTRHYKTKSEKRWRLEAEKCERASNQVNIEYDSKWCDRLGNTPSKQEFNRYAQSVWEKMYQDTGEGASCPWPRSS